MVKVRFDIVVASFVIIILVILGNSLVNINKSYYENLEDDMYFIGCPPKEDTLAVATLEQLAIATEWGSYFAIVAEPDKVIKTNYYLQLNGGSEVEKKSRFSIWFNRALGGNYYDRVYIVELQDGQRVPILVLDGVLDLSEDMVIFPVSEAEFLQEETEYLEALDKKYDLSESAATQWYVNASGDDLTMFMRYTEKVEALKTTNWTIIGIAIAFYTIGSTVYFYKRARRENM